ncbi:hypothetical protein DL771_008486 [Monosporascus sp. 5C6A]|nr:hypothetical protein DL771_008486 [Monosporascus sp. 5C6A]
MAHVEDGMNSALTQYDAANPPPFAPPVLRPGDQNLYDDGGDSIWRLNGLGLTALDMFVNEVQETHHAVAMGRSYEEHREVALRKSDEYLKNRLPRYLG